MENLRNASGGWAHFSWHISLRTYSRNVIILSDVKVIVKWKACNNFFFICNGISSIIFFICNGLSSSHAIEDEYSVIEKSSVVKIKDKWTWNQIWDPENCWINLFLAQEGIKDSPDG